MGLTLYVVASISTLSICSFGWGVTAYQHWSDDPWLAVSTTLVHEHAHIDLSSARPGVIHGRSIDVA